MKQHWLLLLFLLSLLKFTGTVVYISSHLQGQSLQDTGQLYSRPSLYSIAESFAFLAAETEVRGGKTEEEMLA